MSAAGQKEVLFIRREEEVLVHGGEEEVLYIRREEEVLFHGGEEEVLYIRREEEVLYIRRGGGAGSQRRGGHVMCYNTLLLQCL